MNLPSRRERERREHVKHILDVAGQMFAKRGFFKVTMKDIAQQAEFALGTLYGFFKGKQNLYDQAINQKGDELVEAVSSAMARETSPVLIITRFIEAKLRFFFDNLDFVRLYFVEMHGPPLYEQRGLSSSLQSKYRALLDRVSDALRRGMLNGTFAEGSPETLATAIDGQTTAFVFSWLREVSPDSPQKEIKAVKRIFLSGALAKPGNGDMSKKDDASEEV